MLTLKARFDGRVFIPQEPVDLPTDCELEIAVSPASAATTAKSMLLELLDIAHQLPDNPDLPTDLAAQHDHYLYGTPKRP